MACGFVITGCSTGFGRALARQVLAAGHRTVVTARSADQVKDIVDAYADDALALPLDVIDPAQVRAAVAAAKFAVEGLTDAEKPRHHPRCHEVSLTAATCHGLRRAGAWVVGRHDTQWSERWSEW